MISTEDFYLSCNASIAGAQNKNWHYSQKNQEQYAMLSELMV
jgi:hypothetical protein